MKSISLKVILALFITGILVWTGCKKDDDQPVGPSLSNFSVTSTPTGTLSANGDTLKTNVGASLTFKIKASKGNTSEDKYLKQFKVTAELIGGTGSNTVKDTTYTESAKKENVDFTISYTLPANSGTYRFVFTISDYNNKIATKTFFVKAGVPCGIGVSVTSIASDSLTVTVAGSGLTSGTYEFSFDGGTTWTTSTTHPYGTVGTKTILVRSAANPACQGSTTVNVPGRKLRQYTGVQLGAQDVAGIPSLYDADANQTYLLSTISSSSDKEKVDFVCHTNGTSNAALWAPAAITVGTIHSSWASSEKRSTKFYNVSITSSQYTNAVTNADINSFFSGSSTNKSPDITSSGFGFAFETVNASGSAVARGIVWVTGKTSSGSTTTVTFNVKIFTL